MYLKGKVKFRLRVKSDGIITSAEAAKSGGTEKAEWERHKRQKIKIVAGGKLKKSHENKWYILGTTLHHKALKPLRDNGTHGERRRRMEVEEDVRGKRNEGRRSFGNDGSNEAVWACSTTKIIYHEIKRGNIFLCQRALKWHCAMAQRQLVCVWEWNTGDWPKEDWLEPPDWTERGTKTLKAPPSSPKTCDFIQQNRLRKILQPVAFVYCCLSLILVVLSLNY